MRNKRGEGRRKQKQLHLYHGTEEGYAYGVYITCRFDGKLLATSFNPSFDRQERGERNTRWRAINSMGMCVNCGEINWIVLVSHHVFGKRIDPFKITLCANCHAKLHWFLGGTPNTYK